MYHETCTVKGCGKQFSKPTQTGVAAALRMHVARKHTKTIPTATKAAGNWDGGRRPQSTGTPALPGIIIKRKYTKRGKQVETQNVNYCPRCGCPVANVALAMTVAAGMNGK